MDTSLIVIIVIFSIVLIIGILYKILKCPYKYPYHIIKFDISGKRMPNIDDLIDNYINEHGFYEFEHHKILVEKWKSDCLELIKKSKLRKRRLRQFENIIDDSKMFYFGLIRKQTRYKQRYYQRTSYVVYVSIATYYRNYNNLEQRNNALAKIDYSCTISQYNSKQQRKVMSKALRDLIAERDNYTCQICGKYMPDGVGLHIDHIIPISKGGKSIQSNLQVLCSKCNGRKSKK